MIFIKIITVILSAFLFAWGGYSWHNARRYLMPFVITITLLIITNYDWRCLTSLSSVLFLSIGYGEKSVFHHIFGNGWGRGMWALLVAGSISVGLFLTGHLAWYLLLPYLAICFTMENTLKNIKQIPGDLIFGTAFGSIVLLVH